MQQRLGTCYGLWREAHPHSARPEGTHPRTGVRAKRQNAEDCGGSCAASGRHCSCESCSHKSVSGTLSREAGADVVYYTYRAGDKTALLEDDSGRGAAVETDDATRSAACVLCTGRRDNQGDVIEPSGVDLSEHVDNPVVLWDHGMTGYNLPIGQTWSRRSGYTVAYHSDSDVLTQRTFFATTRFADQVYSLVRGGFLRANSIAVRDVDVDELPRDPERGFVGKRGRDGKVVPYKHILTSVLAEVTWTSLPANPDAVRSLLGRGRINTGGANDVELDGIVRKSLSLWVAPAKAGPTGELSFAQSVPDGATAEALTALRERQFADGCPRTAGEMKRARRWSPSATYTTKSFWQGV